jgi:prevent-host-death family protein
MTTMTTLTKGERPSEQAWPVAEAKAHFSELIDRAVNEGPQTITRMGRTTVVVVSAEEWERKTRRRGNLAEFLLASPLRGSDLVIERDQDEGIPPQL